MAYYAVSYQLNLDKDYQRLWDAFEALEAQKVMRSFYFVDSEGSTKAVYDYLRQFIDDDDHLAVAPIGGKPIKHRCYEGTQAWIDARF
jgi:hypothetical protein